MALPYFPLYPKDLLTDDRIAELTTEEVGIWLVVLCRMWIAENELADNDDRISRVLQIELETWTGLKKRLLENGLLHVENGLLLNNRLTYEFSRICAKSDQARRAALIKARKGQPPPEQTGAIAAAVSIPPIQDSRAKLEAQVQRMKEKEEQELAANA